MLQYQEKATIIKFEQLTGENVRLTLQADEISSVAKPGQFVMISTAPGKDPYLRRPFSIHQTTTGGRIQILFKVTGRGTNLLAHCREGEKISVFGPLGHGYDIRPDNPACLIGGGMGIAPILFLAKRICQLKSDTSSDIIIIGGREKKEVEPLIRDFEEFNMELIVATDDGSCGRKGFVTEIFKSLKVPGNSTVYSCGPGVMLHGIHDLCNAHDLECQVSVESVMACGMGACLGCNIPAKDGKYVHVCYEGPVFNAEELIWKS